MEELIHNFNQCTRAKTLTDTESDLVEEIRNRLNRIYIIHKRIVDLNNKLLNQLYNGIDPKLVNQVVRKYLGEGANPIVKSVSGKIGIVDKNSMSSKEIELEEQVKQNYDYMWRIFVICRDRLKEFSFNSKGLILTRNHLLVHAGLKSGSVVTRDTFAISSEGPIIKGSRRVDQAEYFKGAGNYYEDYEEFVRSFSDKVKSLSQSYLSMFKGTVVENSLKDASILQQLQVEKTWQAGTWLLHDVLVTQEQIQELSKHLADGPWYMHFWEPGKDEVQVVFKNKLFTIQYSDKSTWTEVITYGKSLGIPEAQLDFLVE